MNGKDSGPFCSGLKLVTYCLHWFLLSREKMVDGDQVGSDGDDE
jgi:plastocyanin domain-containing protein